jgi:hypothetical protein
MVTPSSFWKYDPATCSSNEDGEWRAINALGRDPSLPERMNNPNVEATYSWDSPAEKRMREYGVDLCPPSDPESWSWTMDNSQFGSDCQWLPSAEDLPHQRRCLLLEYLRNARKNTFRNQQ